MHNGTDQVAIRKETKRFQGPLPSGTERIVSAAGGKKIREMSARPSKMTKVSQRSTQKSKPMFCISTMERNETFQRALTVSFEHSQMQRLRTM